MSFRPTKFFDTRTEVQLLVRKMRSLTFVLCVASLVSAIPSRLSFPDVSIQISFDDRKDPAVRTLASLPDKFVLEAVSDEYPTGLIGFRTGVRIGPDMPLKIN